VNPDNEMTEKHIRITQEAARAKGIQLPVLKAATEGEIDTAFASLGRLQAGGLVIAADAFFVSRREQLVALASRYAVPAIYESRGFSPVIVLFLADAIGWLIRQARGKEGVTTVGQDASGVRQ